MKSLNRFRLEMSHLITRRTAAKLAVLSAAGFPLARTACGSQPDSTQSGSPGRQPRTLKLGVASFSLSKQPVEGVITTLRELEIGAVSLYRSHAPWSDGSVEQCKAIVKKFADAGIVVTSTGVIDLTTDETAARKAFANVQAAGLPMFCGRPAIEALPLVDKLVKEYNVKVAIHNHGPSDLYPTGTDAWKAIQHFDSRIGLCLDVGHAYRAGADPVAEIAKCHERLYEVHLKDTQGPKGGVTKDPSPVVVGHGLLDMRGILLALLKVNYQYQVEFEYEKRVDDKMPGLAESVGYTRGMLAGLA